MADKDQSFNDFIGAAETLIRDGWTSAGNIILHGGSAGGLLVGTTVMRRPELFKGVIADVPFVDVLETMLDADLPLTPPEWPEWGNPLNQWMPNADWAIFHQHRWSKTGLILVFLQPLVLQIRESHIGSRTMDSSSSGNCRGGHFSCNTELNAGHGGPSGRYTGLDDIARIYQVVIKLFDLPKEAPYAI